MVWCCKTPVMYFDFPCSITLAFPSCFPSQRDATETTYYGNVKTEIIEPARIELFIYSYLRVEYANNKGYGGDPPVPDTEKEPGRFFFGYNESAWKASGEHAYESEYQNYCSPDFSLSRMYHKASFLRM